ncbi:MAG: YraN family protein [Rubrobacteridae bacterium]|nr:YraN family protein [Rubrobacteridae bacterium]
MNLGQRGEELSAVFLRSNGYSILHRNYRTKIGEIDIVATKSGILIFCEVKTRQSAAYGYPIEAVTPKKQKTIRTIAEYYVATDKTIQKFDEIRFDVISITITNGKHSIDHIENAF